MMQNPGFIAPSMITKKSRFRNHNSALSRRRVNPDSLASRLGPELIKELESLLVPGSTEMPSFSARQRIQKQFGIDRRHIYDWYHTKGLRVSTKDSVERGERANMDLKDLRSRLKQQNDHHRSDTSVSSTPPPGDWSTPTPPPSGSNNGFLGYETGSHLPGFPLQCFFDSPPRSHPRVPSAPMPQHNPQYPEELGVCSAPSDVPISHYEITSWQSCYDPPKECAESLHPSCYEQPLPREQREAHYQCLVEAVGPAFGVQESVGTYRAFMTQQVQTYFERLVSTSASGPIDPEHPHAQIPTPVSVFVPTRRPSGEHDAQISNPCSGHENTECAHSATSLQPQLYISEHQQEPGAISSPPSSVTPALSTTISSAGSFDGVAFVWPWISSYMDETGPALDIAEIVQSPLLRSRSCSWECVTSDSSALPTPVFQNSTNLDPAPIIPEYIFEDPSGLQENSISKSPFTVSLRTAKESQGLDKMVTATACKEKYKLKKSRPRRSTSNSAGGGI